VGAEKWRFLQDEPCAQVINYTGDRIPSFLPNCMMADHSCSNEEDHSSSNEEAHEAPGDYEVRVAEATISR
jgi:hypothetical protein